MFRIILLCAINLFSIAYSQCDPLELEAINDIFELNGITESISSSDPIQFSNCDIDYTND